MQDTPTANDLIAELLAAYASNEMQPDEIDGETMARNDPKHASVNTWRKRLAYQEQCGLLTSRKVRRGSYSVKVYKRK